jgi:hypothetical protein
MSSEHIFDSTQAPVANLCIRNLNIISAKTQLWPLQSATYYDKEHLMIQCNNNNIKKIIIHLNDTMGGMVLSATGQWFSSGTPVSSANKTNRHDIIGILLKVVLNTINQTKPLLFISNTCLCVYTQSHGNVSKSGLVVFYVQRAYF